MMEHGNCKTILGSLSEYIDGDLEQELCTELERHLSGCENCRIVIDSINKTIYLYQTTTQEVVVPADVRQRLYRRLELDGFLGK